MLCSRPRSSSSRAWNRVLSPREYMPPASESVPPADAFEPPQGPPHAMPAVPLIGMTAPAGLQMKHRSPLGVWLLSIITFGIYGLVY